MIICLFIPNTNGFFWSPWKQNNHNCIQYLLQVCILIYSCSSLFLSFLLLLLWAGHLMECFLLPNQILANIMSIIGIIISLARVLLERGFNRYMHKNIESKRDKNTVLCRWSWDIINILATFCSYLPKVCSGDSGATGRIEKYIGRIWS